MTPKRNKAIRETRNILLRQDFDKLPFWKRAKLMREYRIRLVRGWQG